MSDPFEEWYTHYSRNWGSATKIDCMAYIDIAKAAYAAGRDSVRVKKDLDTALADYQSAHHALLDQMAEARKTVSVESAVKVSELNFEAGYAAGMKAGLERAAVIADNEHIAVAHSGDYHAMRGEGYNTAVDDIVRLIREEMK